VEQIILFDMDNTLCDWDGAMRRDLARVIPDEYRDKIEAWLGSERKCRPPWVESLMAVIRTQAGWWRELEPLKIGMQLLNLVLHTDWETHVLTKGPATKPQAWAEKVEWCRANIVRQVPLTICSDKSMVYGKVLVDDYVPYMEHWLKHRPNGLGLMPAQPYNEGFEHPNVIRVTEDYESMHVAANAIHAAWSRKDGEPLNLEEVL
jgi:5'-nucleotidase